MSPDEEAYAERLAQLYGFPLHDGHVDEAWLTEMLKRVNVLPEALVLTQAANESAWGTSRFATQANNLFGQWCYKQGCGIVPAQRAAGKLTKFKIRFSSAVNSWLLYECESQSSLR